MSKALSWDRVELFNATTIIDLEQQLSEKYISVENHPIIWWMEMSRLIRSDSSLYSLQMKCFYISSDYRETRDKVGNSYLRDIFETE